MWSVLRCYKQGHLAVAVSESLSGEGGLVSELVS
jgi:hypothetical protein